MVCVPILLAGDLTTACCSPGIQLAWRDAGAVDGFYGTLATSIHAALWRYAAGAHEPPMPRAGCQVPGWCICGQLLALCEAVGMTEYALLMGEGHIEAGVTMYGIKVTS